MTDDDVIWCKCCKEWVSPATKKSHNSGGGSLRLQSLRLASSSSIDQDTVMDEGGDFSGRPKRSRWRDFVPDDRPPEPQKRPRSEPRLLSNQADHMEPPTGNSSPAMDVSDPESVVGTGPTDEPSSPAQLPIRRFSARLAVAQAARWSLSATLGPFIADHPSEDEEEREVEEEEDEPPELVSDDDGEEDEDEERNEDGEGEGYEEQDKDKDRAMAAAAFAARRQAASATERRVRSAQAKFLTEDDLDILRVFTLKTEDHLTEQTFKRLSKAYPKGPQLSLKMTKKHARQLSGFQAVRYSCCVNSCVAFVGPFADLNACPHCNEARFSSCNTLRKYYEYIPLIPRLTAMVANHSFASKLQYRAKYKRRPGIIRDVFDGSHYQHLCETPVPNQNFHFFSDPCDIALGLSTDGFGPHRRRKKTCWPIILLNYNLPPTLRVLKQYIIHICTVPGPKKPQDWDSFFWPLAQELLKLEVGIEAFDGLQEEIFDFHAYLLFGFGDIPAVSLITRTKGQNGIAPCRVCLIKGVTGGGRVNYVPLRRTGIANATSYKASSLPMRMHAQFLEQATTVEQAQTKTERNNLSKEYGVKGTPLLVSLSSISFPTSFPFDFMHLIWENLIPNLILFWTGEFKGLDHHDMPYVIAPHIWKEVGKSTAKCARTIPSAFGAPVPNIANQQYFMTAEMYSNWTLFIAPIVLQGRWEQPKYYNHFMDLVNLLMICLDREITLDEVEQLEEGFQKWVIDYERLYYRHDADRLSACPLTIHALLHIAWGIRVAGPPGGYWAFPMERHCNVLLPAIRSRRFPYTAISNFITAMSQLDLIRLIYNIEDDLDLGTRDKKRKVLYRDSQQDYKKFRLLSPERWAILPDDVKSLIAISFVTRYWVSGRKKATKAMYRKHLPLNDAVLQYGRVLIGKEGDVITARELVPEREDSRDSTFIKYIQTTDRKARIASATPEFEAHTYFGRLLRIIILDVPENPTLNIDHDERLILAHVQLCAERGDNGEFITYKEFGRKEIIDLSTIQCLVGRVWDRGQWTFVDRSRDQGV